MLLHQQLMSVHHVNAFFQDVHATQQASQCKLVLQLAEDKKQKIFDKSLGAIKHWLERFDTIIIGPGLGRDEMVHHVVIEVSPQSFKFTFSAGFFLLVCLLLQPHIAALTFVVVPFYGTLLLPEHGHRDPRSCYFTCVDQEILRLLTEI